MPALFEVQSASGPYRISIIEHGFDALLKGGEHRIFLADEYFAARIAKAGIDPIVIAADEHAKSLDRIGAIVTALRRAGATRDTMLVAVGGGVVQDIVTFVASIYMRGVRWTYVPTTLLAMVDSCIGGKSSINVGEFKNIVGTFHPPVEIVIDPELTGTLNIEQRAAGLCEAAKICLCRSAEDYAAYRADDATTDSDTETLTRVIERSLRAKAWFIEVDEFDRAERLVLNFGHSFGHAIEAASGFRVSHGIAVGLGMLAAIEVGRTMGRTYNAAVAEFADHIRELLRAVPDLPAIIASLSGDDLMRALQSDKKHSQSHYALILIDDHGRPARVLMPRDERSDALIAHGFAALPAQLS